MILNEFNIDTSLWKSFKLSSMFNISPTKIYKNMSNKDLIDEEGEIPFVCNSAVNNGIGGYSTLPPTEEGNIITFSDTTDGNTFFYQPEPFIGFSHVQAMRPKGNHKWTTEELLFLSSILMFHNNGLFDYGRKMRRDTISEEYIKLPAQKNMDGTFIKDKNQTFSDKGYIPNWEYMSTYIKKIIKKPTTNKKANENIPELNIKEWKRFYLKDLFICRMGNKIDIGKTTSDEPKYNYVSRDSNSNGVVAFVDEMDGYEPFQAGELTLALGGSYLGSCFVQTSPFYTAQNVAVLKEKEYLTIKTKLFIAALIKNEAKKKFTAFGRELNTHYKKDFSVKLPTLKDKNNNFIIDNKKVYSKEGYVPDWHFMDEYISYLPYSDKI